MALPQRDKTIEEIKRTDLLLEWAVQQNAPQNEVRRVAAQTAKRASARAAMRRSGRKPPRDEAEAGRLRENSAN